MKVFCPNCEEETLISFTKKTEMIEIRDEVIEISLEYYLCDECGMDFEIPNPDYDPLDLVYREYRKRKGFLQPEEFKQFRIKLGLSQKNFSDILEIGIEKVIRYENGGLI